jgi:hypothetical protein
MSFVLSEAVGLPSHFAKELDRLNAPKTHNGTQEQRPGSHHRSFLRMSQQNSIAFCEMKDEKQAFVLQKKLKCKLIPT